MEIVSCEPELRILEKMTLSFQELNMKRQSNQTDDATHTTTMLCHTKNLSNARDLYEHQ